MFPRSRAWVKVVTLGEFTLVDWLVSWVADVVAILTEAWVSVSCCVVLVFGGAGLLTSSTCDQLHRGQAMQLGPLSSRCT